MERSMFISLLLVFVLEAWSTAAQPAAVAVSGRSSRAGDDFFNLLTALFDKRPYKDTMFLMDSSGSISSNNWEVSKDATKAIVEVIDLLPSIDGIHPNQHRIGLVRFSDADKTEIIFKLGEHADRPTNLAQIGLVEKKGVLTATRVALRLASFQFLTRARRSNDKLVYLTTDGHSNAGGDPVEEAEVLKRQGITICTVAIGDRVDMDEINRMSSVVVVDGRRRRCVVRMDSYLAYRALAKTAASRFQARATLRQQGPRR